MNKFIAIGHLTRGIELKYLTNGIAAAQSAIAINHPYKKQDGTQADDVCYIDINLYGRSAEIANQYLKKGSKVCVEGRLILQQWTTQHGDKRSKHVLLVEKITFLDSKNETQAQNENPPQNAQYTQQTQQQVATPKVEQTINIDSALQDTNADTLKGMLDSMFHNNFNVYAENEKMVLHFTGTQEEYQTAQANWSNLYKHITEQTGYKDFVIKKDIHTQEESIPF